jgi:DNA mismatch repair ATPase MutS
MKVILTEKQAKKLVQLMNEDRAVCKQYTYSPEKVLIVKRYLDDNFKKGSIEGIGDDGMPTNTCIVALMNKQTGNVARNMYDYQLHRFLIDKFQDMFTNDDERSKFLGQVMRDWYEDKIGLYGSLSVNHL